MSGAGFIASSPSQIEVNEIINKVDNGTRSINFTEFCQILLEKSTESELETEYKVTKTLLAVKESLLITTVVGVFPSVQ